MDLEEFALPADEDDLGGMDAELAAAAGDGLIGEDESSAQAGLQGRPVFFGDGEGTFFGAGFFFSWDFSPSY